ncbi:UDP-N-acetylmuramoylalanyl-D-glutamate--2,6-diaminopimelate ligase [Pontibacillus chungwhensis BH030062]|uniref:UDP-N-acetylmuramyl-tripeptide synthetase n=1 Tax=Pontibacillus chungwhensis BH030062 TaxID=1385513 RepID=A0A0A2UVI3_9BACI|nr:UDP-N-acetylmuramoyl-L-alanyl-D-glutamate--2,6-diaminopimelate ligase [Pontibacillus chungwhensis]KGP92297.1 UDP-N-acetylmuramoylalanyl-D-glutamate--2,6-diaminopimelate ligase [Pontibacillus chungwhensis BH030062]
MNSNEYLMKDLVNGSVWGPESQVISSVTYDSREISEHDAFVCITGEHHNGHLYIEQAIENGATTIIGTESESLRTYSKEFPRVSFILVEDSRLALAHVSSVVFGTPSESLYTIGVTGTNGKTTVSTFIHSLLNDLSCRTGCLGTAGIWDEERKTDFKQTVPTTPEAPDIHRVLDYFKQRDLKAAVIESTSIAIEQKRLAGINFNVAVHTNLTPEHLEFHGTMEAYKEAKLKLFDQANRAVVNLDDPVMSPDIIKRFDGSLMTYGVHESADFRASNIRTTIEGTSFTLIFDDLHYRVDAPIFGEYNVSNLLAAVATCYQMGYSLNEILSVVWGITCPEGRYQLVDNEAPFQIVLDYAHTPDALATVLSTVKQVPHNRLIVMITGVGLRDPKKRPQMAEVAEGIGDEIVVSVDQPGHADRQEVVNDVLKGFKQPNSPHIHSKLHREDAIHYAFDIAQPGDLVLLTGIGFGGYQIIGDERVPYSEMDVVDAYFDQDFRFRKTV